MRRRWGFSLGLSLVLAWPSAGAAATRLTSRALSDGSVSVFAEKEGTGEVETLVSSMGFALATRDGEPALVLPAAGRRPPRARIGGATCSLSVAARRSGGGTVIDFRVTPSTRHSRSAWERPEAVRARVVARLAPSALKGGSVIVRGGEDEARMVTLGPPEKLGPDFALGSAARSREDAIRHELRGRSVELRSASGTRFHIETETPGEIEIVRESGELAIRFAGTLVDSGEPFAYAVFVGREPYAGPPVILSGPATRFLKDHACFEVAIHAFGAWRDPADTEDVVFRSAAGRPGYYTRDYALAAGTASEDEGARGGGEAPSAGRRAEGADAEPRGWPRFAVRMPYTMSGRRITLTFETKGGIAFADLVVPTVSMREYARPRRRLAGPTLRAPARSGTLELEEKLARLADERVTSARLEPSAKAWTLVDTETGGIDLAAAWRLDRVVAEAGKRGVRIVLVHDARDTAGGVNPGGSGDARAARDAFAAGLRYAEARWGASQGFAASAVQASSLEYGGDLAAYVGPGRGRDGYRYYGAHLVLDARSRRHLWQRAVLSTADVFTGPDVSLEDSAALARFMSAEPAASRDMIQVNGGRRPDRRVYLSRGPKGAQWYVEMLEGRPDAGDGAGLVTDLDLYLDGLDAGRYRLEWWDPRVGRVLTCTEVRTSNGKLDIVAPAFVEEIAGRLVKLSGR